jgi:acetyl esterase/lipase
MAPDYKWPIQLYDAKAALRFLKANAAKYEIDPTRVCVAGGSAGAFSALMMGNTQNVPEMEDLTLGNADCDTSVNVVVDLFGWSELPLTARAYPTNPDDFVKTSVYNYMGTAASAPIIIGHGTADTLIPYSTSLELYNEMVKAIGGENVKLITVEGAVHNDQLIKTTERMQEYVAFANKYLQPGK